MQSHVGNILKENGVERNDFKSDWIDLSEFFNVLYELLCDFRNKIDQSLRFDDNCDFFAGKEIVLEPAENML